MANSEALETSDFSNVIWNELKERIKTDKEFIDELQGIYYFYERKILKHATTDKQNEFVYKQFEDVVFSQFFQGYLIMRAVLSDSEIQADQKVWTMNKGFVRNSIATILSSIFEDENTDWTYTEVGHSFGIQVLDELSTAFDIVKDARTEIAFYGAYKALIEDSRYTGTEIDETMSLRLGTPLDLEFLSPQVFMQAQYSTAQNEIWDLFLWTAVQKDQWVGSVSVTSIATAELPVYLLEIKLNETITLEEKHEITNQIVLRLPEDVRELLQTRLYHTTDLEILVPTSKRDEKQKKEELTH